MLSLLQNPPACSLTLSFTLEIISAALHKAAVSSVHMILLTLHSVAFNDFYNSSAPLSTNKNNYVITCWAVPPVNKDGATGEWQKEKMSFLSTVSFIFSVCSPRSLSFTGWRQKSDAGDGKGWKAETGRAEPMAQGRTTDHGLPRHAVCQCPSHRQNTPSFFALDCYHGDTLFASSVSLKRAMDIDHEVASSPRQTGLCTHSYTHTPYLQTFLLVPSNRRTLHHSLNVSHHWLNMFTG